MLLALLMIALVSNASISYIMQQEIGHGVYLVVFLSPYNPPNEPANLTLKISIAAYNGSYSPDKIPLSHLQFSSIRIISEKGEVIKDLGSLHVHEPPLNFTVQFPSKGKYMLEVQVASIGHEEMMLSGFSKAYFNLYIGVSQGTSTDFTLILIIALIVIAALALISLKRISRKK